MPNPAAQKLRKRMSSTAFAFRGYNTTNLGRSKELLQHALYGPVVAQCLEEAAAGFRRALNRTPDLIGRIEREEETSLETYDEAIALIMGMEAAQMRLLREYFEIEIATAKFACGYSLGEIAALSATGVLNWSDALQIPLSLAEDSVSLAHDATMAVLFTRGRTLPLEAVRRVCVRINSEGHGVMGVSAYLAPNSLLLLGQHDTLDRFYERLKTEADGKFYLRKNHNRWPPLHTPIVWDKCIANRAAVLMHALPGGVTAPKPAIISMVTGTACYTDYNAREILHRWVDHPQRLWDVVYELLAQSVETIIHVGPQPNIIPATFHRLADNIQVQMKANYGMRAMSSLVTRPWLNNVLPSRAAMLRAPLVKHVVLEDWLLENAPS